MDLKVLIKWEKQDQKLLSKEKSRAIHQMYIKMDKIFHLNLAENALTIILELHSTELALTCNKETA